MVCNPADPSGNSGPDVGPARPDWRRALDPRRLSIAHLWAIVALGSVYGYVATMPVESADFWHYLKAGEYMAQSGTILDHERYSFTAAGRPFVNLHWGSQIAFYAAYAIGGVPFLVWAYAVLVTLAFAALFGALRQRNVSYRVAGASILLAFVVGAPCLTIRPQGFSIFLFGAVIYLVERRRLRWIPPLFLVWANLHAAFPIGLAWLALRALTVPPPSSTPRFRRVDVPLLVATAAASLATLATPWGWRLYPAVFEAESLSRAALIEEWYPPTVSESPGMVFFTVAAALLAMQHVSGRRWRLADGAMLVPFGYLVLREQRALIWWAFATAPVVAALLKAAAGSPAAARLLARGFRQHQGRPEGHVGLNWAITIALGLHLIFSSPWLKQGYPLLPDAKRSLLARDTPVAMARVIDASPEPARVYADMTWGGYFSWTLDARHTVFYDARVLPFPPAVVDDYVRVAIGHAGWQAILARYGVNTLAVSRTLQPLLVEALRDAPGWQPIYADDYGIAFRRVDMAESGSRAGSIGAASPRTNDR